MTQEKSTALNQAQLFERGLFLQRMTAPERLIRLISALCPQKSQFDLIRIGSQTDGGYLVPNDLEGIGVCFSPGVDTNSSFELDLLTRFGIGSHLADYSVEGPPGSFTPNSFTKKHLGPVDSGKYITLDTWIEQQEEHRSPGDFILQMDIEGAEYATLLSIKPENLKRFRIMAIEFHHLENWSDPAFFAVVSATFQKVLTEFMVVHNHPNNCCGLVNMGGVVVPRVIELTFLRRDRSASLGACSSFPHALDRQNLTSKPDLVLPRMWYDFERPTR